VTDVRVPPVGTKIVRTFAGHKHVVVVRHDGFEYEGRRYRSVSAISMLIAGRRDGYLFFGLGFPSRPTMMDGVEVLKFGRMMRACFKRYGAPERVLEEVESVAVLTVIETHRKKRLPLKGNRGYYFAAATRQIAEEIKHLLAPYRIGGKAARVGVFTIPSVVPFGGNLDDEDHPTAESMASLAQPAPTPEDMLEGALAERARTRARVRVVRRVLAHSLSMPPKTRRNVAHLLKEIAPGVKTPRRKPTRNAAWNGVARLRNLVMKNDRARRDRRVMTHGEEAAA
jgi:hypothetical protein